MDPGCCVHDLFNPAKNSLPHHLPPWPKAFRRQHLQAEGTLRVQGIFHGEK